MSRWHGAFVPGPGSAVGPPVDVTVYPAVGDSGPGPAPAVLVLPGGGYREHSGNAAGQVARWLAALGFHAFALRYRLLPELFPTALVDARAGLDHIRTGDHGLAVDPSRVGVMGFSAGGHLAGLLTAGTILGGEKYPGPAPRPDFTVLAYAIADLDLVDQPTVDRLVGNSPTLHDELSPTRHLDDQPCPTFVWATGQDLPGLRNTLRWGEATAAAGRRVEVHIYPDGPHGVGLADGCDGYPDLPHTARWIEDCEAWLQARRISSPVWRQLARPVERPAWAWSCGLVAHRVQPRSACLSFGWFHGIIAQTG